jgi:hypothetical protein
LNLTLRQIKVRQMYQAINVKSNPPTASLDYLYKYVRDLVISEPIPNVLAEILKLSLDNPFPTKGINKIEDKYACGLAEGDLISANFNSYWASIAGVISRVIKGRISGYLQEEREILQTSYTSYKSFREDLEEFDDVYKEFMVFEKAKMLGLIYISLIDRKSFNIKNEEQ